MNPPSGRDDTSPPEHYMPQSSSSSSSGGGGGGLYLDAYEVSFPLEESIERPPAYHLNQGQQMMDEPVVQESPHSQYSPFILVSNLRAHLYVALEKNAWLQKRIEELEEERNFLRCQLDRFIVSMRSPDVSSVKEILTSVDRLGWRLSAGREGPACQLPLAPLPHDHQVRHDPQTPAGTGTSDPPHHHRPRSFTWRRKNTTPRMSTWRKEEEEEEEDEDSSAEKGSKKKGRGRAGGEPRMKMRRIFRITHGRERQRVKDPDGVLIRYKKILSTYQRVRSMSRAFQIHGVDRNTMASTSPIAELLLVAPEKVAEVGEFEASKEKLLDYARRCYKTMDDPTHAKVQTMKKTHKLLPISYR
ncbi:hypothetical protein L3Q82_015292 [Scortum barcoo]|uniref:Uncharacterized protein n=1 Tax=Scortum barcoo TaxID=214431 RepID=A0ACB8VVF7_9TELE|nr:hypothetical protein L3Q82_015292 [Scortum barcoo]